MSKPTLTLILVDEDPIFRLGFLTALSRFPQIQGMGEAADFATLREQLARALPDVVLIDPQLPQTNASGWSELWALQATFPSLTLALLTASLEYEKLLAARTRGIAGYFPKGTAINDVVSGLEQLAQGESVWPSPTTERYAPRFSPWEKLLWRLFADGLQQIDQSLQQTRTRLQAPQLSEFDRLFWRGRKRELTLAQWLVQKLMPRKLRQWRKTRQTLTAPPDIPLPTPSRPRFTQPKAITLRPPADLTREEVTLGQLPQQVVNLTGAPLEIDILQPLKRQQLLVFCQQQFKTILQDLQALRIAPEQLPASYPGILSEMWRAVTLTFFGQYCQPNSSLTQEQFKSLLEAYQPIIDEEKLTKIPFVLPLLQHSLFNEPLTVNQTLYPADSLEAKHYRDLYAQNLTIEVANGTMVFILNYFGNQEAIKVALYEQSMLSSRQVARFRNELAWHYQLQRFWLTPKQIFESQYTLFYFSGQGLRATQLYAPRQPELERLTLLPLAVTILLELRDALAPRLRALFSFLGNGFVFVLTQVIGRAIGLIAKGVIQGIGNTWQERGSGNRP